jgi:hypothetical protein
MTAPHELYAQRLADRQSTANRLGARERTVSMLRLAVFAAAAAAAWSAFGAERIAAGWLLVPVALFLLLVAFQERIVRARKNAAAAAAFYARGIERLEDRWSGNGIAGDEFSDDHHPYAGDLDLFGKGSLFELLCIARTDPGRATLADWLKNPADAAAVRKRQEAVQELRERVDLREEISVLVSEVADEVRAGHLEAWATEEPQLTSRAERLAAIVVSAVATVVVLLSLPLLFQFTISFTHPELARGFAAVSRLGLLPLIVVLIGEWLFSRRLSERVEHVVGKLERSERALGDLSRILARFERERFTSPSLIALHDTLRREGATASARIARLQRLTALLDSRRNQFFAPIAAVLLWSTHIAFAVERWRHASGRELVRWIAAVGELEALSSLAGFAFENPSYAMPELVAAGPLFDARGLGHPLLPASRRVANDVALGGTLRLLIVSGSNMSGKSTLMRTVGTNAVLALAGGPVCAASLRVSPLRIGASIRLHDSLQEGASRFYAEILRIRQIVALAEGDVPLLFLLDEILHGTNSHDRRIGAEAIVRQLVTRGAIGLVSTHDLALARIAETMNGAARNIHFDDRMEEGRMLFDYTIREGVVERSNALELMRAIGLDV